MSARRLLDKENSCRSLTHRPDTQSAPDAAANDKARAEALAKLAAAPAVKPSKTAKAATRGTTKCASRATAEGTKRLSALDAASHVLASLHAKEARAGLSAPELIERMAALKLWTSPGGKTPAATLYAAITREIAAKGTASRFARIEPGTDGSRGRFTAHSSSTRRATIGKVKP